MKKFKSRNSHTKLSIVLLFYIFFLSLPNYLPLLAESNAFEEISQVKMDNLDPKLPEAHQLALKRINQYRLSMGLPAWVYDSNLTKMAQAHADYVLINCKAGKKKFGHYEDPSYINYSKEGDEAARTSGLSGGPDPLYGLERLIEGVFHRVQFLNPQAMRVGVGFSYDSKLFCGSTLFVTRKIDENEISKITDSSLNSDEDSKFVVFPPDGFEDTLTKFISEWPDPRPEPNSTHTGYIASIQVPKNLKSKFQTSSINMSDSKGNTIDLWVTDLKNPTYKNPPAGMLEVYGKVLGSNPFSDNSGMVFIMPKSKLELNETYTIDAKLKFDDSIKDIIWKFKTRKNQKWKVLPNSKDLAKENLDFVKTHLNPSDTILLPQGKYNFDKILWFDESINILGGGIGKTILAFKNPSPDKGYILNFKGKDNSLSQLTIEPQNMGGFYTTTDSNLNIDSIHLKDTTQTAIQISPKSKVFSKNSSYTNLGSSKSVPICIRKEGEFKLNSGNYFENIMNKSGACGASLKVENQLWNVSSQSDPNTRTISLFDAFNLVSANDTLVLSSGTYNFQSPIWIQNDLKIQANQNVKILNPNKNPIFLISNGTQFTLEGAELEGDCAFFYLKESAKVQFNRNQVKTKSAQCYFVSLDGDSEIEIKDSDFSDYFSNLFLFSRSSKGKFHNTNTIFPKGKSIQAKEVVGQGFINRIQ